MNKKERFKKHFQKLHPLRLHMCIILLTTALSGILISKLLLSLNLENIIIRYPLSALLAYGVFFVCIKLWLLYISKRIKNITAADLIDIPIGSPTSSPSKVLPTFHGEGGKFSGAGASSSFEAPESMQAEAFAVTSETNNNIVEDVAENITTAAGAADDIEGIFGAVVLAILGIFISIILVGTFYIISAAPLILAETAFQGLLAAMLVKKTREMDKNGWTGSILKATYVQLIIIIGLVFIAAIFISSNYPEATKLSDIFK